MSFSLKRYHKIGIAAIVVAVLGLMVGLDITKPYAVYADGTKVADPYVVKAGDEEIALVADKETAEKVVANVMDEYSPDGAQINSITVDKKISIDSADIARSEEAPVVMTEEEAVTSIVEQNKTDDPAFQVTINANVGNVEKIEAETKYEETNDLYKGSTKVKAAGQDGSQVVTNEVTSVNGTVVTSEVKDEAVLKDSSDKVVLKGTKAKKVRRASASAGGTYGGAVLGSGDGGSIANFACSYVGLPYRYGGSSLTTGADCSGFVSAVYRQYGFSLPHSSGAYMGVGKAVSRSELKAGDIVVYGGHVAIYIGGGKIVHAARPGKGVCIQGMNLSNRTIKGYRRVVE